MTRSIFYMTYNGVFNNTNGIGTQTKTFLSGIDRHYVALASEFGEFDVHLVAPEPSTTWWGYSETDLAYARDVVRRYGGGLHFCPYPADAGEFWSRSAWLAVSTAAARLVLDQAGRYTHTLAIANDIPFLHAPRIIARTEATLLDRVRAVIALYGSSYIHTPDAVDPERLAWETTGLAAASPSPTVRVADVGDFISAHLADRYGVPPASFVPYRSSLNLAHPDYCPMEPSAVAAVLRRHEIPEDRALVLAFGRADRIKGFDLLLHALKDVRERIHLVLNVVPYTHDDPLLAEYRALIRRYRLPASLFTTYSRELPRAVSQWHNTRAVVCPSRGEPLSNIPFEVSLWARHEGAVLVCADRDGYREQIESGVNGLLFAPEDAEALAATLGFALDMGEPERRRMRQSAYAKVLRERDFYTNFRETLTCLWR